MRIVKPISITDGNLLSISVPENDQLPYAATTGYNLKDKVMVLSNHTIYECIKQETSTVTISQSSAALVTWNNHGLVNGRMVKLTNAGGALPAGLTTGTTYYVINSSANTFNLSTTVGGAAVATTSAGSGTHTATSLVNNIDPVTNPTYWINSGATNRWRMFDKSVQSQTTATGSLTFKIYTSSFIDTIPLLNVNANSVSVKVTHPNSGVVYEKTAELLSNDGDVVDLLSYLLTGFKERRDVIFDDIPPYSNTTIEITLTGAPGSQVGVGAAIFGQARDISSTRQGVDSGARVGIDDYSIKTRDSFGNFVITERTFSKRANVTLHINNSEMNTVYNLLADCRAIPVVYIGSKKYDPLTVYGFYKSFEIDIAYPEHSVCSLELVGLT